MLSEISKPAQSSRNSESRHSEIPQVIPHPEGAQSSQAGATSTEAQERNSRKRQRRAPVGLENKAK